MTPVDQVAAAAAGKPTVTPTGAALGAMNGPGARRRMHPTQIDGETRRAG
jgi:hypothetical protein